MRTLDGLSVFVRFSAAMKLGVGSLSRAPSSGASAVGLFVCVHLGTPHRLLTASFLLLTSRVVA